MSEVKQRSSITSSTLYDMLIDQYRLDSHYSQTAVSDIYKARDVNTQQSLALEVLLPSFNRQYGKQFVAKSQAVSQLTHPNIATIYRVGYVTIDRPYVAREFIEGYPFSERLQQLEKQDTPVNSIYALKMVRELADALALAEAQGIYHHYLCPEHIILKDDGTLILADLGVPELPGGYKAYQFPHPSQQNKEFYLSPEQRSGKAINGRSHVYTLGIILQQLLTGIPPSPPPTLWQKIRRQSQVQNLRQHRPNLSPHLYQLVEKCLHKEPWRRFSSLAELTAVIDDTLEAETLYIQTGTELPILPTTKERPPLAYVLIPVALMFLCALVTYVSITIFQPDFDDTLANVQQYSPNALSGSSLKPTTPAATRAQETITSAATNEQPATDLPSATADFKIEVVEPLKDQQYEIGSTVVLTWTWPTKMKPGQSFTVYIADETGEKEVGQVITENDEGVYELVIDSTNFAQDRGIYLWRVALIEDEKEVSASETNMLRLVATPLPQSPTATETPVSTTRPPQPTNTATERPTAVPIITTTPIPTLTPTSTPTPWPTATPTELPTATITPSPSPIPPTNPPPSPQEPTAVPPTDPPPKATIPPPPPATATIPPPPTP